MPASSSTRSESSLLVGSMIRASTNAANTSSPPAATSRPNAGETRRSGRPTGAASGSR